MTASTAFLRIPSCSMSDQDHCLCTSHLSWGTLAFLPHSQELLWMSCRMPLEQWAEVRQDPVSVPHVSVQAANTSQALDKNTGKGPCCLYLQYLSKARFGCVHTSHRHCQCWAKALQPAHGALTVMVLTCYQVMVKRGDSDHTKTQICFPTTSQIQARMEAANK